MKGAGFLLVEFLVYFLVLTVLVTTTFHWVALCVMRNKNARDESTHIIALYAAYDCLVRDIQQAQPPCTWHLLPHASIMRVNGYDVGWELEGTKLVRSQGTYHAHTKRWLERSKALIADTISRLSLQPDDHDSYVHMHLEGRVGGSTYRLARAIMPRVRVLS